VQDAVVTGMRAGEDRRVVRERDRGQRRHRAVPEGGTHLDQARHVRCFAPRRHVVQDVRVGTVEEEPDDVARPVVLVDEVVDDVAVLDGQVPALGERRAAEQRGDRGRDVDQARRARHESGRPHALPPEDERRARLHDAE
jgi:hypothetical protein